MLALKINQMVVDMAGFFFFFLFLVVMRHSCANLKRKRKKEENKNKNIYQIWVRGIKHGLWPLKESKLDKM